MFESVRKVFLLQYNERDETPPLVWDGMSINNVSIAHARRQNQQSPVSYRTTNGPTGIRVQVDAVSSSVLKKKKNNKATLDGSRYNAKKGTAQFWQNCETGNSDLKVKIANILLT